MEKKKLFVVEIEYPNGQKEKKGIVAHTKWEAETFWYDRRKDFQSDRKKYKVVKF